LKVYADASLIVSAFTDEVSSGASRAWLGSISADIFLFSKWCETEIASALSSKVRAGVWVPEHRVLVMQGIRDILGPSAQSIAIGPADFDRATALLEHSGKPLRGGDALHLAIAERAGAALFTLDRRMAEAGLGLGLDVHLLP